MKSDLPLHWKVAAVPLLLAALLVAAMLALTQWLLDRHLEERAGARARQAASAFAGRLTLALEDRADEVLLAAGLEELRGGDSDRDAARQRLQWIKDRDRSYLWLGLLGTDGRVIVGTDRVNEGHRLGADPAFVEGRRALWVSGVRQPDGVIGIGAPVHDRDGRTTAVLLAWLDWRWFVSLREPILQARDAREGLHLGVFSGAEGRFLSDSAPVADAVVAALRAQSTGEAPGWRRVGNGGAPQLASVAPVAPSRSALQLGWDAVALQDLAVAFEPSRRLQHVVLVGGLVIAAVFGVFGYAVSRRLMRPYEGLLGAMTQHFRSSNAGQSLAGFVGVLVEQLRKQPLPQRLRDLGRGERLLDPQDALALLANDAKRLQLVLDALPSGVMLSDAQFRVLYWNKACEQMFGWPDSMVLGRPPQDSFAAGEGRDGIDELQQQLRWSSHAALTCAMRRRDGEPVWGEWQAMSVLDPNGEFVGYLSVVKDITVQQRAEERAQLVERNAELQRLEHEATLSAVIGSASDAIISTDGEGCITLFNPAAERIFGHAAATLLGQPLDALLPPAERDHHRRDIAEFAQSSITRRSMGSSGHVKGLRADGSALELEASISQTTVRGRKLLTAILRDVTQRVRAEHALKQYQLELTALTQRLMAQERHTTQRLAQALHDQLGQTLLALRLSYEAARSLPDDGAEAEQRRLDERVRALIAQASREVRQVLVDLRPPLLNEEGLEVALDNEVRSRAATSVGARVEFDAEAPGGARWPSDVEYAAFMVAREAIANALKHASANLVRVSLCGSCEQVTVTVEDDGVGMPAGATLIKPGHLGMVGMRERAAAIGARFAVGPARERGTMVTLDWRAATLEQA